MAAKGQFHTVIVGGGVAGLEAALGLGNDAPPQMRVTLIAPNERFVYRPLVVREPFAGATANRHRISRVADHAGAELRRDSFKRLDPIGRVLHTELGQAVPYDALLLATGARQQQRFPDAITLDPAKLDEQLHGLVQDVESGFVKRVAFVVPSSHSWPLPIYDLALLTAERARSMGHELAVTLVTPERSPLAVFGEGASAAVAELLAEAKIELLTHATCSVKGGGWIAVGPHKRLINVDRIIVAPELQGPRLPGVPADSNGGFVAVDPFCRVIGLDNVFAAGDMTNFPVKHGSIAAQQADAAAAGIAELAGGPPAAPFRPVLHGIVLGGRHPLFLRAELVGAQPRTSEASTTQLWAPADKLHATHLSEYLLATQDLWQPAPPPVAQAAG